MADATLNLSKAVVDHLRAVMLTDVGADPRCVHCAEIIRALPNLDDDCECRVEAGASRQTDDDPWRCDLCGGIVTEADDG